MMSMCYADGGGYGDAHDDGYIGAGDGGDDR